MSSKPLPNSGSPTSAVDSLLDGKNYRLLGSLGRGSMGDVHLIAHSILKRHFALKVIHSQHVNDQHFVDRMRIEAQATARLHHKNIVEVVDFWVANDGRPCIVMEALEGVTVAHEVMVRGPLRASDAVEYTIQLLSALQAAHDLGVVHRDIKPENLFLHQVAERPRLLKVLDFGFARILPEACKRAPMPPSQPTVTGAIVGTPRFASPEALRGEKVDHRADLFAAGAVLYFMLTRRGPYDRMGSMDGPSSFNLAPPSAVRGADATPELDAIVLKATRFRPEERFQTASEFSAALLKSRSLSQPPAP